MTDTPRTEAELLTIFADQQNHGITAQDMRDFVVSTAKLDKAQAVSVYCYNQSIPVPNNTGVTLPLDVTNPLISGTTGDGFDVNDPNGYISTDADGPDPYYGYDGGLYLKGLPQESVWCCQLAVGFVAGTFVDADRVVLAGPVHAPNYVPDPDPTLDTSAGIFGAPTYAFTTIQACNWGSLAGQEMYTGVITLPLYVDDRFDLWNIMGGYVYQNSGETQTLYNFEADFWRIR